jgi:hypothetical protein
MQNSDEVVRVTKEDCGNDVVKISKWETQVDKSALKSKTLSYSKGMGAGLVPAVLLSVLMGWLILLSPSFTVRVFAAALAVGIGWATVLLMKKILERTDETWLMILAASTTSLGLFFGPYVIAQNHAYGFMAYLSTEPFLKFVEIGFGIVGVILGTKIQLGSRGIQPPQMTLGDNINEPFLPPEPQQSQPISSERLRTTPTFSERFRRTVGDASDVTLGESESGECPICNRPLSVEPLKHCPECGLPHHVGCWDYNQGCSRFDCSENPTPQYYL